MQLTILQRSVKDYLFNIRISVLLELDPRVCI